MTKETINTALSSLKKLILTMETLRSPGGCDWDRQQSSESLKKYILEEAYEVIDAIDRGDSMEICEELGDLLLQVVFQAQIFGEQELFGMAEVAESIDSKLRRRHPHIFASSPREAFDWERIKQEERDTKGQPPQLESRIPQAFPALKKAEKLGSILSHSSTDPETVEVTKQKIAEQILQLACPDADQQATEDEIGDILYNLTNYAKSLNIDAEDALRRAVDRRIKKHDKNTGSGTERQ